ncbi:substrate-binding domain-containing protein [Azotobacter sp. CWF10]
MQSSSIPLLRSPYSSHCLPSESTSAFSFRRGGCAEAARAQGDVCRLLGTSGPAHFRKQNQLLEQLLHQDLDSIALLVTQSEWLAEHALRQMSHIPMITFNADLNPTEQHLRRSHVGFDEASGTGENGPRKGARRKPYPSLQSITGYSCRSLSARRA